MTIRLYQPLSRYLTHTLGNQKTHWEKNLGHWIGFPVTLPLFFWEVHLPVVHGKLPSKITLEAKIPANWLSVFYEYNLNKDMEKFILIQIIRKCKLQKEKEKRAA